MFWGRFCLGLWGGRSKDRFIVKITVEMVLDSLEILDSIAWREEIFGEENKGGVHDIFEFFPISNVRRFF